MKKWTTIGTISISVVVSNCHRQLNWHRIFQTIDVRPFQIRINPVAYVGVVKTARYLQYCRDYSFGSSFDIYWCLGSILQIVHVFFFKRTCGKIRKEVGLMFCMLDSLRSGFKFRLKSVTDQVSYQVLFSLRVTIFVLRNVLCNCFLHYSQKSLSLVVVLTNFCLCRDIRV